MNDDAPGPRVGRRRPFEGPTGRAACIRNLDLREADSVRTGGQRAVQRRASRVGRECRNGHEKRHAEPEASGHLMLLNEVLGESIGLLPASTQLRDGHEVAVSSG